MPGLLKGTALTDVERRANDGHRWGPVLAGVAVLVLHAYLFTAAPLLLGIPGAGELLLSLGIERTGLFDEDGTIRWDESPVLDRFEPPQEEPEGGELVYLDKASMEPEWQLYHWRLLGMYGTFLGGFLAAYFLPLERKRPALALWALLGVAALYGLRGAAGLLFAHLVVYQVFHPSRRWLHALAPGLVGGFAFGPEGPGGRLFATAALAIGGALVYREVVLRALAFPRGGRILRFAAAQSALIVVVAGGVLHGLVGHEILLAVGILLFFWQWQRTILYYIDFKDGFVPHDLALGTYLGVFLTPGTCAYWDWFNVIGQGFNYANNSFLCEDKNRIVLGGVKLLLLSAVYLILWDHGRLLLAGLAEAVGIPVHQGSTWILMADFTAGQDVSAVTVLATSLIDLFRWIFIVGGLVHLKVGLWRLCGYRMDPFFDKPWLATNLIAFWSRFTFHYREFLVRAFYYPVFLRHFKRHRALRIVAATLAAATAGNMIWGHVTEEMYQFGLRFENFHAVFRTWPYFVLLGLGISVVELYGLGRRKKRKPWTPGPRILLDLLAVYATLQFYSLIHLFRRMAPESTTWDAFRLFVRAFGLEI